MGRGTSEGRERGGKERKREIKIEIGRERKKGLAHDGSAGGGRRDLLFLFAYCSCDPGS